MFAATNSAHSTPRSAPSDHAPLPSFVVTSSNDTPFAHAATPVKSSTATLNPDAREFRLTPSFGGALFAMPQQQQQQQQQHMRWGPSSLADFPARPSGSSHGSPAPAANAPTEVLDGAQLVNRTEAYMHELYDRRCREEGLHMVSVFHLHPRTTNKQLSSMFFPTGASAAEVLEPRLMPEPLANAFNAVRQRAGAVFFARKDFAMVGVEKIHDFVPHGQHQPLLVRYCGPDAAAPVTTPLSAQVNNNYNNNSGSGVVVSGGSVRSASKTASPPSARPTPPHANFRDPHASRESSFPTSAVPTLPAATVLPSLDRFGVAAADNSTAGATSTGGVPAGAAVGATAVAAPSNTYDVIDQHFLQKYAGENVFLVGVHNLAYGTSPKSFYKMFYPMGAVDAELLPRPVSVDGKLRCSGVAIFTLKGMAMEAAEKMNDFVPHGQRRPVVARFLHRTAVPPLDVAAATSTASAAPPGLNPHTPHHHQSSSGINSGNNLNLASSAGAGMVERREAVQHHNAPQATASTPRANASDSPAAGPPSATSTASSAAALLHAIDRQLHAKSVSDAQLAADLCALVLCNDSAEAEAQKLADTLRDTLLSMGDHAPILSSPLSGALRTMHSTLGIRFRTAPATAADNTAAAKKGVMFLQLIGRTLMMLVADTTAARQTRIVAAVQCAYLYQYPYLPKTPLCFATVLFQKFSAELSAAKAFLCREAEVPSTVAEERTHRPWVTLMDALHEMVQLWRSLDPRQYSLDAAREPYERFVCDFRGMVYGGSGGSAESGELRSPVKALRTHEEAGAEACTPRNDALEVSLESGAHTNSGSGSGSGSGNGATNSAKKSQLVTPSARPTPRRVVSKSYSTSASDWKGKQSTPVHAGGGGGGGAIPPQVMLSSPASDYTQGVSEFSVESSGAAGPFNSALRSLGLTPQHPSMRFAFGSRVAGTTQASPAPPTPTMSAVLPSVQTAVTPLPGAVLTTTTTNTTTTATPFAERSDAAMTECTVYITKLPSCFTAGQVRRLLLHFGDFRKVRLCHDDKETTRSGTAEAVAAHQLKFHDLCFGFVEFAEPSSARAMVEFFRNEVHTATAFDFLRTPAAAVDAFDDNELQMLRSTRTSQARNPIHDQQLVDATRAAPCFFGLIKPEHTIETYAEAITADDVAAAAKALEAVQSAPAQPRAAAAAETAAPPKVSMAFATPGVFSTAAPFSMAAGTTAGTLQPMDDVHFPRNFPYDHIFARTCGDEDDAGDGGAAEGHNFVHHDFCPSKKMHSNLHANRRGDDGVEDEDEAPVLVEDDDDDDGLQEYQVQEILKLLN